MALNKEGNGYIIGFSVVMVVVMGIALAVVAQLTAPFQAENVKLEKMQNILTSIGINYGKTEDTDDIEYERKNTEAEFKKYIKGAYVYDKDGVIKDEKLEGIEQSQAFSLDLAAELKKPEADQLYPMFMAEKNGEKLFIVPMRGKGLWDAVWGYVSIKQDGRTVAGASFAHKGETPGLGAEIAERPFQKQFIGKTFVNDNGEYTSIRIFKPGKITPGSPESKYGVDGISGGTLTSNGVDAMLNKYFMAFTNYVSKASKTQASVQ